MKNPFRDINWFSPNLALKMQAIGAWILVSLALLVPHIRDFCLGMAFSWLMMLTYQIFQLKPMQEVDRDKDLVTRLNLQ